MAQEQTEKRSTKKQLVLQLIRRGIALAVLLAVVAGVYLYLQGTDHGPAPEQASQGPIEPPEVDVLTVSARTVELQPSFLGQTEAVQNVEIRARVRGFIEQQAFHEGTRVEAGQKLFQIDPRSFQAEVKIAEARVASARAQLFRAQQQVTRYEQLVEQNAATMSELEQWQTDAGVAEANLQLAQAQLEQAKLDLSYTSIEAPITGMIGRALKDVGSYVNEGVDSLLAVVRQVDPIYVRYSVSETDLLRRQAMSESGRMRMPDSNVPMQVAISLSDGRSYPHQGTFDFMDVVIDPSTGTAQVRASVPNPEGALRPGQFVHVHLLGMELTQAILVPQAAVMLTPTGATVYVLDQQQQVTQRTVQLGEWHGDDWLIERGLTAGDRLVVSNISKLRPGMAVTARPVDSMTARSSPVTADDQPGQ